MVLKWTHVFNQAKDMRIKKRKISDEVMRMHGRMSLNRFSSKT
jgi:hypothetical protein